MIENPYNTAPEMEALLSARKLMDDADARVNGYVQEKMKGYLSTYASVYAGSKDVLVQLTGHGRVWKDARGHRVYKRTSVPYGDLAALDTKIEEAKTYYQSLRKL